MSNRGFPKAKASFLLVVLALAARPAAGEPLVITSEIGSSASSASYARYLGADRALASEGQRGETRGLKDVFEACMRCDAGAGLDLNKSAGGIGMWGRWQGNGFTFAGNPTGRSQGAGGNSWGAPAAAAPVVASLAARGGLDTSNLSNEEIAFLLNLFRQWWERGFNGGVPGKNIFGNGGAGGSGSPTATPEPATLLLVGGGMAAAAALRRRQQRRRTAHA
jgi:hypothetical protein